MLLSVCCLVLVTAGCGGDDDKKDDGDKKSAPTKAVDEEEDSKRAATIEQCDAEVSTTGAYEADWSGEATVRTGGRNPEQAGPAAVFELVDKKNRVGLYSPGPDFKGAVSLSVGDDSYSSDPADAEGLDIDKRGRTADVDVEVTTVGGDKIQLEAEFTCGKARKKKSD